MIRHKSPHIYLAIFFLAIALRAAHSAEKRRFPIRLDNAQKGRASTTNPLFTDVVQGGVPPPRL